MSVLGKISLLSVELSRGRAWLAGGGSAEVVLANLRQWALRVPVKGTSRAVESLMHWCEQLCFALRDTLPLGAPIGRMLREVQPMIRREEKLWAKLQGIERQFGFQGAIAIVLPWAVVGVNGELSLNLFSVAGAVFQLCGLSLFYFVVKKATRRPKSECDKVFELLLSAWMRVLAGMSFFSALEATLRVTPSSDFRAAWERCLTTYKASGQLTQFEWPASMPTSGEVATLFELLLKSGSPASEALADVINQLDDERQAVLEERLSGVPTKLSLVFCAFMTPAVFLLLIGSLWPTLQNMTYLWT